MREKEYAEICEATRSGESRLVEHQKLGYTAEVVGCTERGFLVEAFGHRYRWPRQVCRESSGARPLGPSSGR